MGRLDGKVAVITGAARGMGAATARLFIAEGAKIVVADVLDMDGHALAQQLGEKSFFFHLDVSEESNWHNLVAETVSRFGGIDVLINNAAIFKASTILDCEPADFKRHLNVNIFGTFLGIKSVAPLMIKKKKGSIVNISSVAGMLGFTELGAYGPSKWAVRGITRMAAVEIGPLGVRVNCVVPGAVNTPMGNPANWPADELNKRFAGQPIPRIGKPEEVAQASLFLASDESSYICGADIVVDGGQSVGQPNYDFNSAALRSGYEG